MKSPEQKIAQRFVVLAYQRYRLNRKWRKNFQKKTGDWHNSEFLESENEAWNHLQIAKKIYYEI